MSVRPGDILKYLNRILAEEARLLGEFERVLRQETEIVRGEDTAAIERIGDQRHSYVDTLTRLDAERAEACRMFSFGNGRDALERLFQWADSSGALQRQWLTNLELARRCKNANDQNGAIVAAKLGRVQQLLGKLRGASAPPVYSAKGARYGDLGLRDLGRA
ncbi:MAG TPA: flagellar protein FlgN [Steroidobacteraceae bacterium]|jgi:flagellar biosynthesis/type III secretory pathway chaperone